MNRFAILSALLTVPSVAHCGTIHLYLEPDSESDVVAELDSSNERFQTAQSVFDAAKLAEGWNWFEYEGSFRGFVENRQVGKDLEVSIGALVHLRPSSNSPILSIIEEGDPAKVIWGGDWVEIEFTKAVPVYFRYPDHKGTEVPLIPSASPEDDSTGIRDQDSFSRNSKAASPSGSASEGPAATDLLRHFDGILQSTRKRAKSVELYQWKLVDPAGKRIAYVDTSKLLLSSPLQEFEGQNVVIYGAANSIKNSKSMVVIARSLRLKL